MSWTVAGGHNMAKVIQLRDNGQLEEWAHSRVALMPEREKLDAAVGRLRAQMKQDPQSWLEAHLPALDGPHSDRPWAHISLFPPLPIAFKLFSPPDFSLRA